MEPRREEMLNQTHMEQPDTLQRDTNTMRDVRPRVEELVGYKHMQQADSLQDDASHSSREAVRHAAMSLSGKDKAVFEYQKGKAEVEHGKARGGFMGGIEELKGKYHEKKAEQTLRNAHQDLDKALDHEAQSRYERLEADAKAELGAQEVSRGNVHQKVI